MLWTTGHPSSNTRPGTCHLLCGFRSRRLILHLRASHCFFYPGPASAAFKLPAVQRYRSCARARRRNSSHPAVGHPPSLRRQRRTSVLAFLHMHLLRGLYHRDAFAPALLRNSANGGTPPVSLAGPCASRSTLLHLAATSTGLTFFTIMPASMLSVCRRHSCGALPTFQNNFNLCWIALSGSLSRTSFLSAC